MDLNCDAFRKKLFYDNIRNFLRNSNNQDRIIKIEVIKINLSKKKLKSLPDELFDGLINLTEINLYSNNLESLPWSF